MGVRVKHALCAVMVAVVWAGSVQAGEATPLSGDAIGALVKGKRIAGQRAGTSLRMRFADDGTLSIQEGHAVESGRWSVDGDTLCIKVPKWAYEGCGKVVSSAAGATVEKAGGGELLVLTR